MRASLLACALFAGLLSGCDTAEPASEDVSSPRLVASASVASGTVPFDVTYTATGPWEWANGVRMGHFEWTFADGTTATGATVTHPVLQPGDAGATVRYVVEATGVTAVSSTVSVQAKGAALPKTAAVREVTPDCPPQGLQGTHPAPEDCDRTLPTVVSFSGMSGRFGGLVYLNRADITFNNGHFVLTSVTNEAILTRTGTYQSADTQLTLSLDQPLAREYNEAPLTLINGTIEGGQVLLEWLPMPLSNGRILYQRPGVFEL